MVGGAMEVATMTIERVEGALTTAKKSIRLKRLAINCKGNAAEDSSHGTAPQSSPPMPMDVRSQGIQRWMPAGSEGDCSMRQLTKA